MSVVDPGSETGHHPHHTGHRWLDITLAVSAAVVSLVSLFLALQHGRVMERMVEASTWPYVVIDHSNANPDGTPHVVLTIRNKGVGPAKIESIEVFYQGKALAGPRALLGAILAPVDPGRRVRILQSDIIDSVLSPKESINLIDLEAKEYSADEYAKIGVAFGELTFRTCYCSVFDECSVLDTRKALRPVVVKACAVPDRMFEH
jgi:hypothetical protein